MIKYGKAPFLECSSRGDKRFSAFYARVLHNGRIDSIESHYQAAKVFDDGSTGLSWREAKGRHPINCAFVAYLYGKLWDRYIADNPVLLLTLKDATGLSDIFGKQGCCCQATELWRIRNHYHSLSELTAEATGGYIIYPDMVEQINQEIATLEQCQTQNPTKTVERSTPPKPTL